MGVQSSLQGGARYLAKLVYKTDITSMVNWVYTPTIINYHTYRGWLRNPNHQLKTVEKHPIILFGFLPSEIGGAGLQDFASIHSRLESKKPSGKDHETASILPSRNSGNHCFFPMQIMGVVFPEFVVSQ